MNAVFGADRHYLFHIRRVVPDKLLAALREKSIEPSGHGLNEHVQRLSVGIPKRMDDASGHKDSGSGRNFDPVLPLQERSWT